MKKLRGKNSQLIETGKYKAKLTPLQGVYRIIRIPIYQCGRRFSNAIGIATCTAARVGLHRCPILLAGNILLPFLRPLMPPVRANYQGFLIIPLAK